MADMQKLSRQMVEYAERFADITDAAKGRGRSHSGGGTRWLILPAAGAGLYALFTSKRTKGVIEEAKSRASDLPEDLVNRVRQTSQSSGGGRSTSRRTSQNGSASRSQTRRKTSSRKSTSSR
jgi:hypothetical protein